MATNSVTGFCQIPKDLTTIRSKILFSLNFRQLICFGSAVIIGVPTYLLTKNIIGNSAAVLVMIGLMLPFFFLAMFERDGLPAEKILRNMLRVKVWRGKRPYRTENFYKYLNDGRGYINNEDDTQTSKPHKKSGK